jgi:hypothetical protein
MQIVRIVSSASAIRLIACLCILVTAFVASPGKAGEGSSSGLSHELDLWSQERIPDYSWDSIAATPNLNSRAKRHHEFMAGGIPLEYRSRWNPYPATTKFIREGGNLYKSHCAACHGAAGLGDGEAGRDLTPSPAFLEYMVKRPRAVDEYLLWTISEGGSQFSTQMPAFKDDLSDDQIWQIVVYMRSGFPAVERSNKE